MHKLVRESLLEFHQTGDPLKSLDLGINGMLETESKKHKWLWDPISYTDFKYDYFNPEIYDIINYYGNFIKITKYVIEGITNFSAIVEDISYSNEDLKLYNTPEEALSYAIETAKGYYEKDLKLSEETYSIAGRLEVPR